MAHNKHAQVAAQYGYRCGYCGVSEVDVGGALTIDHHEPVSAGGDDSDANLIYACIRCNQYKGDFTPNADDLARGRRLLHPLLDDPAAHLREESDGLLIGLTATGRFHILRLHLNRPQLIQHRLTRRDQILQWKTEADTRQILADKDALIEELLSIIEQLRDSG